MDVEIFEKLHSGPEIWPFENELPKSVTFGGKIDVTLFKRS